MDSDGDHFLLSPIFCRTPVSRDIDCYSLGKISKILVGVDILSTPIFVMFYAWQSGTISRYSAGESQPLKAGRPAATAHLATSRGGINNYRENRRTSARSGRSQLLQTLPGQNSKEILPRMRQHFVEANILLTPTFCRLEYFTEAKILLTQIFCRRQHFVDMNILSTPTFC